MTPGRVLRVVVADDSYLVREGVVRPAGQVAPGPVFEGRPRRRDGATHAGEAAGHQRLGVGESDAGDRPAVAVAGGAGEDQGGDQGAGEGAAHRQPARWASRRSR